MNVLMDWMDGMDRMENGAESAIGTSPRGSGRRVEEMMNRGEERR
jgi:hypothetical protein